MIATQTLRKRAWETAGVVQSPSPVAPTLVLSKYLHVEKPGGKRKKQSRRLKQLRE
jgi:hypothetical protein